MDNTNKFYCYSIPLKSFLRSRNIKHIYVNVHPRTKMTYWIYQSCEELSNALAEYGKFKYGK